MKIGYSKTYPVVVQWEKNWLEDDIPTGITLDSTDEEIKVIMEKVRRIQYALKAQVESFHYESTKAAEKIIKQNGQEQQVNKDQDDKTDREFEEVKNKLQSFKYREQAQEYLDTTDFKMTVAAKNIVNNIKPKPTPK